MDNRPGRLKKFAHRHPFFFALAFFAVSMCIDIGILVIGRVLTTMLYTGIVDIAMQSLLALFVLRRLGWLQQAGFNGPSQWRKLYLLWVPGSLALLYLLSLYMTSITSVTVVVLATIYALLVGLNEEARFRGVILQALLPYGFWGAATLSSLFFGLIHLVNLLVLGPSLIVFAQSIGAFLLGFGFAGCRLRTKTLWPLIVFHAVYDLTADITLLDSRSITANISALSPLTIVIALIVPGFILACYGLYLLRPQTERRSVKSA